MAEILDMLMQLLLLNRLYMHKPNITPKSDRDVPEMLLEILNRMKCVK